MKKTTLSSWVLAGAFWLSTLAFISANPTFAQANRPNPGGDGTHAPAAAAGYVSGVFSLLPGQTVRVSAVNAGKKVIPIQMAFVPVSDQGKIGIGLLREATPAPGDAMVDKFTFIPDGTSNRQLMYVQIRVQNATDLKEIAPSLEVFSEQGGPGPHYFLGGNGFIEIRPIWVPS